MSNYSHKKYTSITKAFLNEMGWVGGQLDALIKGTTELCLFQCLTRLNSPKIYYFFLIKYEKGIMNRGSSRVKSPFQVHPRVDELRRV